MKLKIHEQFFYEYDLLYRPYVNGLNTYLAKHNLFRAQFAIMYFISNEGPHSIVEIARHHQVEKPTTTRMVQRLEQLKYVEVIPGEDKREKIIQLSPLGIAVRDDVFAMFSVYNNSILEGVTEEEQLQVSRILAIVRNNLLNK